MPAQAPGTVQIFGRRDSRDSQKAIRFFRERRVPVSFVDIATKPPSRTELRRFAGRHGSAALVDTAGRLYRELGLGYMRMDDEEVFERILVEPRLLRLPLVRMGSNVTIGADETAWRAWLRPGAPPAVDRKRE